MKNVTAALASACLLCSATAHAAVYQLDFTATRFSPGFLQDSAAPQSSITGSITFTAAALGAAVTAINAIDLTIAGHTYTLDDIGASFAGGRFTFGRLPGELDDIHEGTDDFYLSTSTSGRSAIFVYAVAGSADAWLTSSVLAKYKLVPVASVPEPGAWAMLGLGLAGLGLWQRRRQLPQAGQGLPHAA